MPSMSSLAVGRRVALVTGAAQGMGRAIALRLAQDPSGIDVAVLDIKGKEEQLASVVDEIRGLGAKGMWMVGDVADEEDVKVAIARTVEELGGLDIVRFMQSFPLSVRSTSHFSRWWRMREGCL